MGMVKTVVRHNGGHISVNIRKHPYSSVPAAAKTEPIKKSARNAGQTVIERETPVRAFEPLNRKPLNPK